MGSPFWMTASKGDEQWRQDWHRQQERQRVEKRVYDRMEKIDESHPKIDWRAKSSGCYENSTKDRIFSSESSKENTEGSSDKSVGSKQEDTPHPRRIESATSLLIGSAPSVSSCDDAASSQIDLEMARRKMLIQNCPELRQLRKNLDAKLVSAQQEIQVLENRCSLKRQKEAGNLKESREVSLAEMMEKKDGGQEGQENVAEANEVSKRRQEYLESLRKQMEAKEKAKKDSELTKAEERKQVELFIKKCEDEKLMKYEKQRQMRQQLIDGLDSKIKMKEQEGNERASEEQKIAERIKEYEAMFDQRQLELSAKKDQHIAERIKMTEKICQEIKAQREEVEGKRKVLDEYDHLIEEKKMREKEEQEQQIKTQKLSKWQQEIKIQLELRQKQLAKENDETQKIKMELDRLEELQREEETAIEQRKRTNRQRNREELDRQIEEKRSMLERQKIIESELEANIGQSEKTLDSMISEEKEKMLNEFKEKLSSIKIDNAAE